MDEKKEKLNTEDLDKVSGGSEHGPNDFCPICGSKDISLVLYARLHHCDNCGYEYD